MTLTLPPGTRLGRPGEVIAHGTADPPLSGIIQFADPGTITAQAATPVTISSPLDLSAASRAKAHATASATARRTASEHAKAGEARDAEGRWARVGAADLVVHHDGTVAHKKTGTAVGALTHEGGQWVAHHGDGTVSRHATRPAALREIVARHNKAGTAPAETISAQAAAPAGQPGDRETDADRQRLADNIRQQAVAVALAQHRIETARQLRQLSDEHAADMHKVLSSVRSTSMHLADSIEADEAKVSRHRLAWHVGILVAGAVLAGVTLGMGAPIAVTAAGALAPGVIQELIDFFKGM